MFKAGEEYRQKNSMTDELCLKFEQIILSNNTTEMTIRDKKILEEGKDKDQGSGLVQARIKNKK